MVASLKSLNVRLWSLNGVLTMELIEQESYNILLFGHPELLSYGSFSDIDSGWGLSGDYADFFGRETGHHEDYYLLLL